MSNSQKKRIGTWKAGRSEGQYFVFRVVQMVWITEMLLWGWRDSGQENELAKTWKLQKEMVLRRYKGVIGRNGQYQRGRVLVERCVRLVTVRASGPNIP